MQATEKESNAFKGAQFSNHARQRAGQRGVRMTELYLVIAEGDRVTPVGSNCVALAISRERRKELVAEGYPPSVVDRGETRSRRKPRRRDYHRPSSERPSGEAISDAIWHLSRRGYEPPFTCCLAGGSEYGE